MAAASLKSAFTKIGQQFKTDNSGSSVDFEFAGSSELATELTQGATADVFASADTAQMDNVAKAGLLAGDPKKFASNSLVIVTAPGNPKKVGSFATSPSPGSTWWSAKNRCLADLLPANRGQQRRAPQPGQRGTQRDRCPEQGHERTADAALVYVTDALSAGNKVTAVNFPRPLAR